MGPVARAIGRQSAHRIVRVARVADPVDGGVEAEAACSSRRSCSRIGRSKRQAVPARSGRDRSRQAIHVIERQTRRVSKERAALPPDLSYFRLRSMIAMLMVMIRTIPT